ncbi:class I SAM-dependent methyltransferase [Coralliovum pocilloporae]|uniref:class I SAM-dependent methyltransferase n=1 Tax=Coralliovum pocilloporae TaxID=3066369 RepID=UPI00330721CC
MAQNLAQFPRDYSPAPHRGKGDCLCPVCGMPGLHYLSCDFSKSCNDAFAGEAQFPQADIPVHYWRCIGCSYLFTRFFDHWTPEDYARHIYNEAYLRADPPADGSRCRALSDALLNCLPRDCSFLDYGCGEGYVVERLRRAGYDAEGYDPYFGDWADVPERRFDCILCVEVLEHLAEPLALPPILERLLKPGGTIILTTLLTDYATQSNNWYLSPRNGHVGAHSEKSLAMLFPGIRHVSPATHTIGDNNNALDIDRLGRLVTTAVGTGPCHGQ